MTPQGLGEVDSGGGIVETAREEPFSKERGTTRRGNPLKR
jgi:hypothetical protein